MLPNWKKGIACNYYNDYNMAYQLKVPFSAVTIFITIDGIQIDLLARSLKLDQTRRNGNVWFQKMSIHPPAHRRD